jgi:hypothetical protein
MLGEYQERGLAEEHVCSRVQDFHFRYVIPTRSTSRHAYTCYRVLVSLILVMSVCHHPFFHRSIISLHHLSSCLLICVSPHHLSSCLLVIYHHVSASSVIMSLPNICHQFSLSFLFFLSSLFVVALIIITVVNLGPPGQILKEGDGATSKESESLTRCWEEQNRVAVCCEDIVCIRESGEIMLFK